MNATSSPNMFRPVTRLCALFAVAGLLPVVIPAQSIVNATVTGKTRNEYSVWFTKLSFSVNMSTTGTAKPPALTFTVDLYDEDDVGGDDGRDTDLTETSPTVTVSAWKFLGNSVAGTRWQSTVSTGGVQEIDVTDPLPGDWPDPRVEITVTVGKGNIVATTLSAPNLPSVGEAEFGIESPMSLANTSSLQGEPIAAFSRGYDDISRLPDPFISSRLNQGALYFACELKATTPATDKASGPGRIFVRDAAGDLWPEDLYAAKFDARQATLGTPRFLNLNTAHPSSQTATDEIYVVRENSDKILYALNGKPAQASLFLDLALSQNVTALAVEDTAPRGVWSAGDKLLYATENSTVIHSWTYGKARSTYPLTARGVNTIPFAHFDQSNISPSSLLLGNIVALAVSTPKRSIPKPAGRVIPEVLDYDGSQIYGPAVGGEIGFVNSPLLGSNKFRVTLDQAPAGTWALLLIGVPIKAPGQALPLMISTSKLLIQGSSLNAVGLATQTSLGQASRQLSIPSTLGLVGAEIGFQWLTFIPSTLPVDLSDAGVVTLR